MYSAGETDTILDVGGLLVGQAEDSEALTGITVLLAPAGAVAGGDLRGGGSGIRELNLLDPRTTTEQVHAVTLSGGSAFGLDAAGGVMAWLEEQGIGFDVGVTKVPLVPQAVLFDLAVGSSRIRPDAAMAREACRRASARGEDLAQGNFGAGCGATVGKLRGGRGAMKSGIGSASLRLANGFTVGALVAVNALGDIYEDGRIIAGLLEPDSGGFADSVRCLLELAGGGGSVGFSGPADGSGADGGGDGSGADGAGNGSDSNAGAVAGDGAFVGQNTTIGIIACNGKFSKAQCGKIAAMGHNGMARAIRPVHTTADGDMLFALATGAMPASVDAAGEMAAITVERAIIKAIKAAAPAGGLPAWQNLRRG
ncbi:MAG: P1 family peptidase [Peptococcaceae bacterium]|jgi:L-aminopeptidase/D-esterase-like protein|nr:P1 family peptidase [Peptococcaceae bacterium]